MSDNWQPIETAPRPDCLGPYILVSNDKGHVDVAFWEDDPFEQDEKVGWRSATNHDGYRFAPLSPIHWMPLPSPPGYQERAA